MVKKIYYFLHSKFSRSRERGEYSAGYWQHRVRQTVLDMTQNIKGSLLEAGCGEGLFLEALAGCNPEVSLYGIDIWDEILQRAARRCGPSVNLRVADAAALPYEDNSFDAAVCMNVLFNLPTEQMCYKALDEMARVVRKNGKIIVDIRNAANPLLFFKYRFAPLYDETVRNLPLRTYHLKSLLAYMDRIGIETDNVVPVGMGGVMLAPLLVVEGHKR